MRIELKPDASLLIVVPRGTRDDQWLAFVLGKRDWINQILAEMRSRYPGRPADHRELPAQIDLLYTGQQFTLHRENGNRNKLLVEGDSIRIRDNDSSPQQARELLIHWLKTRAREAFAERLHTMSADTGMQWNRLTIRGQRTRWGSCSANCNISLNYKLLFLPEQLVDHVLLHELVHTRELNHSDRFWALMQRYDPECMAHRKELKLAGRYLPAWLE
jgi:hypothetical protein